MTREFYHPHASRGPIPIRRRSLWGRLVRFPGLWIRYMRYLHGHPLVALRLALVLLRPAR